MEITVQPGDTLTSIAAANPGTTPVSIANANNIKNINEITVGQVLQIPDAAPEAVIPGEEPGEVPEAVENELVEKIFDSEKTGKTEVNKYDETGALVTGDYSAADSDSKLGGLSDLTVDTKAEGVLGKPPEIVPGDEEIVTPSEQGMVADFEVEPVEVKEPKLDDPPVVEEEIVEEPGDVTDLSITDITEASAKQTAQIVGTTLPEDSKVVYEDVLTKIDGLGFEVPGKDFYDKIAEDINKKIEAYNTKISDIAEEKMKPTFEGWNKFLAVLGAAMGAYGSAMTGTPNFALKIIDGAIDRDTQAFLKSKEIRTKSLENQRMDLIMRRGELLQFAQNRVSQLMQSETFKLGKAETQANVQAIYDGIELRKSEAKQNMQLVLAGHIVKLITSEQALAATLNKEEKAKLVSHITFKDGKGDTYLAPAYVAPTVDEAKEARKKQRLTKSMVDIVDQLEPLYDDAARFAPGVFSETRIKINALNKKLEALVKVALGMGAHYTPYEVTIVAAQIPSATDWTEMVGTAKMKINALRDSMVIDMNSERQGVVANYSTVTQKRKIPGLRKGLTKASN